MDPQAYYKLSELDRQKYWQSLDKNQRREFQTQLKIYRRANPGLVSDEQAKFDKDQPTIMDSQEREREAKLKEKAKDDARIQKSREDAYWAKRPPEARRRHEREQREFDRERDRKAKEEEAATPPPPPAEPTPVPPAPTTPIAPEPTAPLPRRPIGGVQPIAPRDTAVPPPPAAVNPPPPPVPPVDPVAPTPPAAVVPPPPASPPAPTGPVAPTVPPPATPTPPPGIVPPPTDVGPPPRNPQELDPAQPLPPGTPLPGRPPVAPVAPIPPGTDGGIDPIPIPPRPDPILNDKIKPTRKVVWDGTQLREEANKLMGDMSTLATVGSTMTDMANLAHPENAEIAPSAISKGLSGAIAGAPMGPLGVIAGGLFGAVSGAVTAGSQRAGYEQQEQERQRRLLTGMRKAPTVQETGGIVETEEEIDIPIQAEEGEVMLFPDGRLVDSMATEKHKDMKGKDANKVTDIIPSGTMILSNSKKRIINLAKIKDHVFTMTKGYYSEEENVPGETITMGEVYGDKGKKTPAEMAKKIRNDYPIIEEPFEQYEIETNAQNLRKRAELLQPIMQMQEGVYKKFEYEKPEQFEKGGMPKKKRTILVKKYAVGGVVDAPCPPGFHREAPGAPCIADITPAQGLGVQMAHNNPMVLNPGNNATLSQVPVNMFRPFGAVVPVPKVEAPIGPPIQGVGSNRTPPNLVTTKAPGVPFYETPAAVPDALTQKILAATTPATPAVAAAAAPVVKAAAKVAGAAKASTTARADGNCGPGFKKDPAGNCVPDMAALSSMSDDDVKASLVALDGNPGFKSVVTDGIQNYRAMMSGDAPAAEPLSNTTGEPVLTPASNQITTPGTTPAATPAAASTVTTAPVSSCGPGFKRDSAGNCVPDMAALQQMPDDQVEAAIESASGAAWTGGDDTHKDLIRDSVKNYRAMLSGETASGTDVTVSGGKTASGADVKAVVTSEGCGAGFKKDPAGDCVPDFAAMSKMSDAEVDAAIASPAGSKWTGNDADHKSLILESVKNYRAMMSGGEPTGTEGWPEPPAEPPVEAPPPPLELNPDGTRKEPGGPDLDTPRLDEEVWGRVNEILREQRAQNEADYEDSLARSQSLYRSNRLSNIASLANRLGAIGGQNPNVTPTTVGSEYTNRMFPEVSESEIQRQLSPVRKQQSRVISAISDSGMRGSGIGSAIASTQDRLIEAENDVRGKGLSINKAQQAKRYEKLQSIIDSNRASSVSAENSTRSNRNNLTSQIGTAGSESLKAGGELRQSINNRLDALKKWRQENRNAITQSEYDALVKREENRIRMENDAKIRDGISELLNVYSKMGLK